MAPGPSTPCCRSRTSRTRSSDSLPGSTRTNAGCSSPPCSRTCSRRSPARNRSPGSWWSPVSADARTLAERYGASTLGEALNLGQTSAVTLGARSLECPRGGGNASRCPPTFPSCGSEDIDALLAAHRSRAFGHHRPGPGRSGLERGRLLAARRCCPFRFGENSFHPHLARARALGIEPRVVPPAAPRAGHRHPRRPARLRRSSPRRTRAYRYPRGIRHPPAPRKLPAAARLMTTEPSSRRAIELTVHFAHVAYHLAERFARRETGIRHFQTWNVEDTFQRCAEADVLVLSGFWDDAMLDHAAAPSLHPGLCGGVRALRSPRASGQMGVRDGEAAAESTPTRWPSTRWRSCSRSCRQIHTGRDHQRARHWRGMVSQPRCNERTSSRASACSSTGSAASASRLAVARPRLRHARVSACKRDTSRAAGQRRRSSISPNALLLNLLPEVDFVALTCPLERGHARFDRSPRASRR